MILVAELTQKGGRSRSSRIQEKGWNLAKTFITECEDIWGWIDGNYVY